MATSSKTYPVQFDVDYPEKLSRLTTFFRLILIIPIAFIMSLLTATSNETVISATGEVATRSVGGISAGLWLATLLMILFRQRYPRWWFDFALELERFGARIGTYVVFMTDQYPSTVDAQAVHLEIEYPDVEKDLKRGMPLVKWFLAIPHYVVLIFLFAAAAFAVLLSWFAVLFTARYPRVFFDYLVGVFRWALRVQAYAFFLATDKYPPFSLK